MVIEDHQQVNMDRHFPRLRSLTSSFTKDLKLKIRRDVPNQKVIDKIVDQLNSKNYAFLQFTICIGYFAEGSTKENIFHKYY